MSTLTTQISGYNKSIGDEVEDILYLTIQKALEVVKSTFQFFTSAVHIPLVIEKRTPSARLKIQASILTNRWFAAQTVLQPKQIHNHLQSISDSVYGENRIPYTLSCRNGQLVVSRFHQDQTAQERTEQVRLASYFAQAPTAFDEKMARLQSGKDLFFVCENRVSECYTFMLYVKSGDQLLRRSFNCYKAGIKNNGGFVFSNVKKLAEDTIRYPSRGEVVA